MIDDRTNYIPLITLWDFLEDKNFGMAQFYRGLQGNGRVLQFQQSIYHGKVGQKLPAAFNPLLQVIGQQLNKDLLKQLDGRPWILGGQQFVHLFSKRRLHDALVVVFDLLPIDYPDNDPVSVSVDQYKNKVRHIRFARRVVTISKYSKQRIIAHFGIEPEKISVVPFGIDTNKFKNAGQEERRAARLNLRIPESAFVILYVGSEQRRKNLTTLVKALSKLHKMVPEILFLKVGQPQSKKGRDRFLADLAQTGLEKFTKIIDYVSEEELPKLYGLADLFVFPSVGEGFGVPLLEAMASGVPIITTQCCSIPEVVGDVALMITDPYDPSEWCESMKQLLDSPEMRQDMGFRGCYRASQMQWEASRLHLIDAIGLVNNL